MPVKKVVKDGKTGYQFGETGTIYFYKPNDKESRERAKKKAEKQGQAVRATGWKE